MKRKNENRTGGVWFGRCPQGVGFGGLLNSTGRCREALLLVTGETGAVVSSGAPRPAAVWAPGNL